MRLLQKQAARLTMRQNVPTSSARNSRSSGLLTLMVFPNISPNLRPIFIFCCVSMAVISTQQSAMIACDTFMRSDRYLEQKIHGVAKKLKSKYESL